MSDSPEKFDIDALRGRVASDEGAPEFPALAEALRRAGMSEEARHIAEAGVANAPSRLAGQVALALIWMDQGQSDRAEIALRAVLDGLLEPYRLDAEPEAMLEPVAEAESALDVRGGEPERLATDVPAPSIASMHAEALENFDDHEIDDAIESAESQPDQMHSANTMAERVLDAEAPFDAVAPPDSVGVAAHDDVLFGMADDDASSIEAGDDFELTASKSFATQTMAGLLDRQGDHSGAESIRESIGGDSPDVTVTAELDAAEAPETVSPASMLDPDSSERQRVLATLEQWLHNLQRGQI
jgi:hypothetical protein